MTNLFTGSPVIYELDPYKQSTVQQHQMGAIAVDRNGNIFRYARVLSTATDFVAGKLYTSQDNEDNHVNQAIGVAASVGDTSVEFTAGATAVDANEYDEGYLAFVDTSPEGETYRIKSHDASAGSANVTINIEPALLTAVTTSSEASLLHNPWNNPLVGQLVDVPAAGIPLVDWDVSVANYGWLQTRGVVAALGDTAGVGEGDQICISNQVDGAVGARTTITEVQIGLTLDASVAGEFHPVYLMID